MLLKKKLSILFALCLTLTATAQTDVKLLDWSWSTPTLDYLEKNIKRMNDECPYLDGLVISVRGQQITTDDGKKWTPFFGNAWSRRKWELAHFEDFIARYKKLDMGHFTDNFFYMTTNHVDFDWLSDDDCAAMASNFGIAAQVAKACGFKGLAVDIEEYGRKFWRIRDMKTDKLFDEVADVVFKRGQEWGQKVFSAYPDIIIFMPFCLTMGNAELSIPFMNGVIDVMPPTALIYEGMEAAGYGAKRREAYPLMQRGIRKLVKANIRPENQRKARAQLVYSPAFYLDAYFSENEKFSYRRRLEPERSAMGPVRLFAHCLTAAAIEADPYVWLYGERRCWWSKSEHRGVVGTWEEAADGKGLAQAIMELKNPAAVMDFSNPQNLIPNGDFKKNGKWSLWQVEWDQKKPVPGHGAIKDGKCTMYKVTCGCWHQNIPCKPNQTYLLVTTGCVKNKLSGTATASLIFQDTTHKWLPETAGLKLKIPATGKPETVWGYITSPDCANYISVQCGANTQAEGGEVYFNGIYLVEK